MNTNSSSISRDQCTYRFEAIALEDYTLELILCLRTGGETHGRNECLVFALSCASVLCLGISPELRSAKVSVRNSGISQRGDLRGKPGNRKYLFPPYTRTPNINHAFPLHISVGYGN